MVRALLSRHAFDLDVSGIERRLRQRVSLVELFALMFAFGCSIMLVYVRSSSGMPFAPDFDTFLNAPTNGYQEFYYAYWSVPIFQALRLLPGDSVTFVVWSVVNIFGVWFAARVFGGNAPIALLSYQMLYTVFYGQITGLIVAGLALLWWGLHREWWFLAGIGLLLAAIKWQMGVPPIVALWLLAETSWRNRLLTLILPVIVGIASLIIYPLWVVDVIRRLADQPPVYFGNIALWQTFGVLSLLLWLPPVLLPLSRGRRIIALAAAGALAIPYYQHTGLIALYVLPVGWLGLLGNLGYLYLLWGETGFSVLAVVPLIAYGWVLSSRQRTTDAASAVSPGRG